MKILLNRVDERLVHGQVLASWAKKLQARQLVVIDDQLAGDQFAETVLTMSLPGDMGLKIFDVSRGSAYIAAHNDGTPPGTILLMKTPETVRRLWELGYRPSALNIGGMAAGPARRHLCRSIYASPEEIGLLQMFQRSGTEVYFQVVYAENKLHLADLL